MIKIERDKALRELKAETAAALNDSLQEVFDAGADASKLAIAIVDESFDAAMNLPADRRDAVLAEIADQMPAIGERYRVRANRFAWNTAKRVALASLRVGTRIAIGMLACLVIMLSLSACSPTKIKGDKIRGIGVRVLDRHDAYVESEKPEEAHEYKGESKQAMELLMRDDIEGPELSIPLIPCLIRHDRWVEADDDLADVEKRTAIRSSKILADILEETNR